MDVESGKWRGSGSHTRLEFSQQADEKEKFIIAVHDGENKNNTAQRTALEVLLQQQQEDDALVSVRCGAGSKSCAAAAASPQVNHENIHRAQLMAATTAAVTRARAAQTRPQTVPQSGA